MPEKRHYQNDNSQISREGSRMKTVWMWEKKESGFVNAGFWSGGRGITHLCFKNTKTIGNNNKWSIFTKRIKEVVGRWREGWARMTNPHLVSTWSIQEPRMVTSPSNWPSLAHYRIKGEICNLLNKKIMESAIVWHMAQLITLQNAIPVKPRMSGLAQSKVKQTQIVG